MHSQVQNYAVTFASHFDALTFFNHMKNSGVTAKLAPVPRKVSASCGTCVLFSADSIGDFPDCEIEAVYMETPGGFVNVWT